MACPNCWHCTCKIPSGGIGNYSINELIRHTGGNLDVNGTCNVCHFNIREVKKCTRCTSSQPCCQHYASGYNGTLSTQMPVEIHNLYMRNSPYKQSWSQRPKSIGQWYGFQPQNYVEAVAIAKRFTEEYQQGLTLDTGWDRRDTTPLFALNALENQLKHSFNTYKDFWHQFHQICTYYFASSDPVSTAMLSYYSTLRVRNLPN